MHDGRERVARDNAALRGTGDQAISASRYTATLLQLTDDAMSGIAIGQLARRVLHATSSVLRADAGHVLEADSGSGVLSVLASRGLPMVIPKTTLDKGNAPARLLESGAPMLAVSDYDTGEFAGGPVLKEAGVRSGLTALIRGAEAPYGLVSLYAREPRSWAAEEIEFLQLAANVLSVAVATKVASDDRRVLMCRLVRAQEEERKRIAVEIHDDAVQVMTAVNLQLAPLIEHLEGQKYRREGRQVQETVRLTIGRLRRLLFQLTPPELQRHGLASSLRLLLETLQEDSGVRWELDNRLIEEPARLLRWWCIASCRKRSATSANTRVRRTFDSVWPLVRAASTCESRTTGAERHLQPNMSLVTSGWSAWARALRCQEAGSASAAFPGTGRSSSSGSRFRARVSSRP